MDGDSDECVAPKKDGTNIDETKPNIDISIGIDLGTTNCCVSYYVDNDTLSKGVHVVKNMFGNRTTPSCEAFDEDGSVIYGETAREEMADNSQNTIYDAKRLIGRFYTEPEVQNDQRFWTFQVANVDNHPYFSISQGEEKEEKLVTPTDVSALILEHLKMRAEEVIGQPISKEVITVPAHFNNVQRNETIQAAKTAGLDVYRIINEPTAAAIAYAFNYSLQDDNII